MSFIRTKEMIAWENGELGEIEEVKLFASLVKENKDMPIKYRLVAESLMAVGIIDIKGNILINLGEIYG